LEIILLYAKDMNLFEAMCHSFSTLSTGGFSTRNNGLESFSAYTQYVIAIFMMIGGINFIIFYYLVKRMFRKILDYHEFWVYLGIIILTTTIITIGIKGYFGEPWELCFRKAFFNSVSILTTSGFITTDFMQWPVALIMIIFFLMLIGGMAGSTSGGIKVVRQCLLIKNSYLELKRLIHPNAVLPLTFSKKNIDNNTMYKVMAFLVLYILVSFCFILIMSFLGLDFESSIGAVVTSIGNIGPGLGSHGRLGNFSALSDAGKWILSFVMLLGRLEIFTVLVIFTPKFWKK
jgi:trk system potassium uptake protein TrkH